MLPAFFALAGNDSFPNSKPLISGLDGSNKVGLSSIREDREHRAVQLSLLSFNTLSLVGKQSYIDAADLYRACRKKGFTVRRTVDLLIAQTALEHDAELLHNDRDFDVLAKVCGLKICPFYETII